MENNVIKQPENINQKRTRRKTSYDKICNKKREKLIELVNTNLILGCYKRR